MNHLNFSIVILAAGKGKRMNNPNIPKVLVEFKNRPLLDYVLELATKLSPKQIIVVVGHLKDQVINYLKKFNSGTIDFVEQTEQLGTGHAVQQVEPKIAEEVQNILILSGDVPLLTYKTTNDFITMHNFYNSDASVLSSIAPNPTGYGRIVRDEEGRFNRIIEEKDANESEKLIKEINSGVYIINKSLLFDSLKLVQNNNAQKEFYLTDVISILNNKGKNVNAFCIANFDEIQGVNSMDDLNNLKQ